MRPVPRAVASAFILVLGLGLLAWAPPAGGAEAASPAKVLRWESNLSIGGASDGHLGVVKSFWWYLVPKVISLGLSFDYFADFIPFILNVGVTAPIPVVTPFICAGAGGGLTVGGITSYGGGLKVRLGRKVGLLAEYRKYHYSKTISDWPPEKESFVSDYVGAGILWRF